MLASKRCAAPRGFKRLARWPITGVGPPWLVPPHHSHLRPVGPRDPPRHEVHRPPSSHVRHRMRITMRRPTVNLAVPIDSLWRSPRLWVRLALGFGALVAVVVLAITQFRALALHGEQMMRRDCWRRRVFDPTCRKSLTRPNTQKQQRPCAVDLRACGSVKIGGLGQFGVGANKEAQNVRGNESTPLSYQSSTPLRDLRPAAERCRWAINAYGPPQSSGGAAHFPPTHGG